MSSSSSSSSAGSDRTSGLSSIFWTRIHRYRALLRKRWWVPMLTISLALCVQAWRITTQPPTYQSSGKLMMDGKVAATNTDVYREMVTSEFQKTTIAFITSKVVQDKAMELLEARQSGVSPAGAPDLEAQATGTIFTIAAVGTDAAYTQQFLQATLDAYLAVRRDTRIQRLNDGMAGVMQEIKDSEKRIADDDNAIVDFQNKTGLVNTAGETTNAAKELLTLQGKLVALQNAADNLELQDPDQPVASGPINLPSLDTGGGGNNTTPASTPGRDVLDSGSDGDLRGQQQQLIKLQSEYDELARDLKPRHPKMIALQGQIDEQKKLLANSRSQNIEKNKDRLKLVRSLIARTQDEIKEAQQKTLELDKVKAQLDNLRAKRDRDAATYAGLQKSLADMRATEDVDSDTMTVLEKASAPVSVQTGWIKALGLGFVVGVGAGIAVLVLLDRIDDRMGSFSDFQSFFSDPVIGQIPREMGARAEVLKADDVRHQLVESYRNIRSSLLYMPLEGARPKTLLITSAIPNEGKSTIATNLALVMAFAGMKTLLIDGDLRRGAIHDTFGLHREPGLTDVLTGSTSWREAARQTGVDNLQFISRGKTLPQPSEYLLNKVTDELIKDVYPHFDYIIFDSSPVLAADDTASLAPKIDAVLFVVRMAFTSAKMVRKSMEILDKRQANIPGMILNFVDTSSPEFVYYQYPEYYHTPMVEPAEPAKAG